MNEEQNLTQSKDFALIIEKAKESLTWTTTAVDMANAAEKIAQDAMSALVEECSTLFEGEADLTKITRMRGVAEKIYSSARTARGAANSAITNTIGILTRWSAIGEGSTPELVSLLAGDAKKAAVRVKATTAAASKAHNQARGIATREF